MDGQPPLVQTLASPERGGAPKGRRGFASPELRIFDSWEVPRKGGTLPPLKGEGDRRRRRWWRGSSHLTVRTVPKNVRLRSLFWNGGGEINPFPEFYGNRRFALRDNYISPPLSGFARLGRCPRPRCGRNRRHCRRSKTLTLSLAQQGIGVPYFEEKGLEPKNLFIFCEVQ